MVEDMGDHGRALEILEKVLTESCSKTKDLDAVVVLNRVIGELSVLCPGDPSASPFIKPFQNDFFVLSICIP